MFPSAMANLQRTGGGFAFPFGQSQSRNVYQDPMAAMENFGMGGAPHPLMGYHLPPPGPLAEPEARTIFGKLGKLSTPMSEPIDFNMALLRSQLGQALRPRTSFY